MPHSRQSSQDTFDLSSETRNKSSDHFSDQRTFLDLTNDQPAMTPLPNGTTPNSSRPPSGTYGVALTSPDERGGLPSQRESLTTKLRRKSSPATPDAYADYLSKVDHLSSAGIPPLPADRNSVRSYSYDNSSKRRSQYYEEQFQYKDNAVGGTRERMQRQSPVVAELKTNVIVS